MHRRCFHAAFACPTAPSSVPTSSLRRYASTITNPSPPKDASAVPSKPDTTSKRKPLTRSSKSTDQKRADIALGNSRKSWSPSKTASKDPPPSHSVGREASVWVPRSPSRPKVKPEIGAGSVFHPLLAQDKLLPGQWEPNPATGIDPAPLKRLLLRPSADPAIDAITQDDPITSVANDTDWIGMSFAPGTFVEARKNETNIIAVVLTEMIEDQKWKVFSLALTGEVVVHLRHDVQFAIPGFISSDIAARCGHEPITSDPSRVNARVQILKKLKQLNMDVEASYNTADWARHRQVNVYNETRSIDPTRWAKTTVKHVTNLMWQQPRYFHYYAVHRYLMEHPLHFVATDNSLTSQTFYVRPLRDVEEVQKVERWIAEHREIGNGELRRFKKNARQAIERYWTNRNERESGPMTQKPAVHTWTEQDQIFLRFLLRSLAPWRSIQRDPYQISKVNLIKILYPKIFNVSDVAVFQCLKELGVVAPWHDIFETIHHANPLGDFDTPDPYNKENEEIAKRSFRNKAVAGAVLGPEDLHPADPLDSVRHDFGDMTVFVIDEATAEELDDGISVERIPSEPDKYWAHAHIADPASLLHPGHILSLRARERGSTLYFRQRTFPLFPPSLVHDPFCGPSLGIRSSAGLGDRTLTFSVKLDTEGNILDHKIRAGIIRKVRKVSYSSCDDLLGVKPPEKWYPFGRRREDNPTPPSTFTEEEAGDLKLLFQLAQQQVKRRFAAGIFMFTSERATVDVLTVPDEAGIRSPSMSGSAFGGFPDMEYSVTNSADLDQGSRMIVTEMMKLASRVASRVALEKDIPLLRRALDPIVPVSDKATKAMLRARTPNGYVPMHKHMNHIAIMPSSTYTLEPKRHTGIGIPAGEGYSRTTSPLRRFEDLVVHWQLHHLLLGSKAGPRYPFSLSEMEQLCIDVATLEKINRKLHQGDDLFHSLLFMKRWREETERGASRPDPLGGTLTAYKMANIKKNLLNNTYVGSVVIPKLGIKAHLVDPTSNFYDVPLSSPVKVKVKNIDLAVNRIALYVELKK